MSGFEPKPFHIIDTPEGLKAFTDPLRLRVLNILRQRAATNQQVADTLGEPHAKVLYHVRILLDAGLIRLVDQQIKGGNVEKYYRAIAALFGLRVGDGPAPGIVAALLEVAQQEAVASEAAWPADLPLSETRRARMSPERRAEFFRRVNELHRGILGWPGSWDAGRRGSRAHTGGRPRPAALCIGRGHVPRSDRARHRRDAMIA